MPSGVVAAAAQEAGVDQGRAGGVHLGHEGVVAPAVGGLEHPGGLREGGGGGVGVAGHVGVAGPVHRDAVADVVAAAAQEAGVDQGRAGGVHLGHEGVGAPAVGGLERPRWSPGRWRRRSRCGRSRRRCRPRPPRCRGRRRCRCRPGSRRRPGPSRRGSPWPRRRRCRPPLAAWNTPAVSGKCGGGGGLAGHVGVAGPVDRDAAGRRRRRCRPGSWRRPGPSRSGFILATKASLSPPLAAWNIPGVSTGRWSAVESV